MTVSITFDAPIELMNLIDQYAKDSDRSRSSIIRLALKEFVAEELTASQRIEIGKRLRND